MGSSPRGRNSLSFSGPLQKHTCLVRFVVRLRKSPVCHPRSDPTQQDSSSKPPAKFVELLFYNLGSGSPVWSKQGSPVWTVFPPDLSKRNRDPFPIIYYFYSLMHELLIFYRDFDHQWFKLKRIPESGSDNKRVYKSYKYREYCTVPDVHRIFHSLISHGYWTSDK